MTHLDKDIKIHFMQSEGMSEISIRSIMEKLVIVILLMICLPATLVAASDDDRGQSLLGTRPPELQDIRWLTSEALHLQDLKGKVVLIRWWTGPTCRFCAASAPVLNEFNDEFADEDFLIIGLYHHKSRTALTDQFVQGLIHSLDFQFPVGIDLGWENLNRWWLQTGRRGWTSVSFLLDRQGVIRYIHPGGSYAQEPLEFFPTAQQDYQTLRSTIRELLSETGLP